MKTVRMQAILSQTHSRSSEALPTATSRVRPYPHGSAVLIAPHNALRYSGGRHRPRGGLCRRAMVFAAQSFSLMGYFSLTPIYQTVAGRRLISVAAVSTRRVQTRQAYPSRRIH
jgi:hypothetical protein